MSAKTEEKLMEFTRWYMYHKETITDVDKRSQFFEHAVQSMLILITYMIEDIQKMESRHRIELPKKLILHDDIRAS